MHKLINESINASRQHTSQRRNNISRPTKTHTRSPKDTATSTWACMHACMHKQTNRPSGGAFDCRLVGCVQEPSADEASERLIGNGWLQIGRGVDHPGGKRRARSAERQGPPSAGMCPTRKWQTARSFVRWAEQDPRILIPGQPIRGGPIRGGPIRGGRVEEAEPRGCEPRGPIESAARMTEWLDQADRQTTEHSDD